MKKMFLIAASLVAALAANATDKVYFDYTATSIYDVAIGSVFIDLNNVTIVETTAPAAGQLTGKNSINLTTGGVEASFSMGGVVWSYTNSNDGTTIAKQYGNYVQPNGKDRKITIPATAGQYVQINVVEPAAGVIVEGIKGVTSVDLVAGVNEFEATGNVVLTTASSKPKFSAISVSDTSTGVEDAEAAVVKSYSVKSNGQVVNAKVYNEPVVEVSVLDNGKTSAKTVINKK